jgi:CheY-like chemotaxis protein
MVDQLDPNACTILVIDDDRIILESIGRQLRNEPMEIDFESDPEHGLERIGANSYDLVLCDIKMKPINGIEVLRRIKAAHDRLPVIIVSAFVDDQLFEEAKRIGCSDFLIKPVRKGTLVEAIWRVLAIHFPGRFPGGVSE